MPGEIFLSGQVQVGFDDSQVNAGLVKMADKVLNAIKKIESGQKVDINIISKKSLSRLKQSPDLIKALASSMRALSRSSKLFTDNKVIEGLDKLTTKLKELQGMKIGVSTEEVYKLKQLSTGLKTLSGINPSNLSGVSQAIGTLKNSLARLSTLQKGTGIIDPSVATSIVGMARALRSLGNIKIDRIATALKAIKSFGTNFKFPISDAEVSKVERFAMALEKMKAALPTLRQFKTQTRISDELKKQEAQQKLQLKLDKQRNSVLHMGWNIIKSTAQMIGRQIVYSAIWSTIYGTIYRVNQLLREGVEMFTELEEGAAKALRTGLSMEQVAGAFVPEGKQTPSGQPGVRAMVDSYRELITMQALAFSSKHSSSLKDYTDAVYELASANINLTDSLDFADTSMKAAIAAEGDIVEVTRSLAGLYNIFGDSIEGASSKQEKFKKIADTVIYTWSKEQIELSELNNALKYSSNLSQLMGVDYQTLIVTIGHLNTNLIRSSTAGTGMRQTFNAIAKDMPKISELFTIVNAGVKEMGGEMPQAFNPHQPMAFIDLLEILYNRLVQTGTETGKFGKLTELSVEQIGDMLDAFKLRGGNVVATLIRDFPILKAKIEAVKNMTGGFVDGLVKIQEMNVSTQMKILGDNLKALPGAFLLGITNSKTMAESLMVLNEMMGQMQITLFQWGKTFSTVWKAMGSAVEGGGPTIKELVGEFIQWVKILGTTAISIGRLLIELGPLLKIINELAQALFSIGNIVLNLGAIVVRAIIQPFLLFGTSIKGDLQQVIILLSMAYEAWNITQKAMSKGLLLNDSSVTEQLDAISGKYKAQWDKIEIDTKKGVDNILADFDKGFLTSFDLIGSSWDDLTKTFDFNDDKIKTMFDNLDPDTIKILQEELAALADEAPMTEEAVKSFINNTIGGMSEFDVASKKFGEDTSTVLQDIVHHFQAMGTGADELSMSLDYLNERLNLYADGIEATATQDNPFMKMTENVSKQAEAYRIAINEAGKAMQIAEKASSALWADPTSSTQEERNKALEDHTKAYQNFLALRARGKKFIGEEVDKTLGAVEKKLGIDSWGQTPQQKEKNTMKESQEKELKDFEQMLAEKKDALMISEETANQLILNLKEKHQKDLLDLDDKYLKEEQDKKDKFMQDTASKEDSERTKLKQKYEEMKALDWLSVEERIRLEEWYQGELNRIREEELKAQQEKIEKEIENEKKKNEAIEKLRDELLKNAQEMAQVELDIDKQKQLNMLKQQYQAELSLEKNPEKRELITARYEASLAMLEAEYGMKDALLQQEQAQERINALLEKRALKVQELASLSGQELEDKKAEISAIDLTIAQEKLNIEKGIEQSIESQIDMSNAQVDQTKAEKAGVLGFVQGLIGNGGSSSSSSSGGTKIGLTPNTSATDNPLTPFQSSSQPVNALQASISPYTVTGLGGASPGNVPQSKIPIPKFTPDETGIGSGLNAWLKTDVGQPPDPIKPANFGDKLKQDGDVILNLMIDGNKTSGINLPGSLNSLLVQVGREATDYVRKVGIG